MLNFGVLASIVPFDPSIDTPLGHRNLVLIYGVTALAQLAYAGYAFHAWRMSGRLSEVNNDSESSNTEKSESRVF